MLSIQELRNLRINELNNELNKAKRDFYQVRIGIKTRQEKAVHKAKLLQKYIARIFTIMKENAIEDVVDNKAKDKAQAQDKAQAKAQDKVEKELLKK